MNKKILTLFVVASMLFSLSFVVAGNNIRAHNGKANHLYLYEKDPTTWEIDVDGAWGKMMYKEDSFVFNGHELTVDVEYCLINYAPVTDWTVDSYPNPWPGSDSTLMASGTPNKGGNLNLVGSMEGVIGKIWLVPCSDFVGEAGMISWNPTEYLFENNLI